MAILSAEDVLTVSTSRGSVRVRDTGGNGTPLLLVHAVLVDGDLYARLVPLLTARGYRCILPELPMGAHRLPMRADADLRPPGLAQLLVEVLDALGVAQVHVVGVDTGGALTQMLMANHGERVDRVVLTACDAYDAFPPPLLKPLLSLLKTPGVVWATAQLARLRPIRRLAIPRSVTHAGVADATVRRWLGPLRDARIRRDLGKVLAGMNAKYTLAAAAANRTFPRPVLVAWGDDDRLFPRCLGERLAADLPYVRLVTLPDCAAFAALDQPRLLAEYIDGHVSGDVSGPHHAEPRLTGQESEGTVKAAMR